MDKKMSADTAPVLQMSTCLDLYARVLRDAANMEKVGWDFDTASTFAINAWHLVNDWIRRDKANRSNLTVQKTDVQKIPEEMRLVLNVLKDIANGTKHFKLDADSERNRVVTETHSGKVGGYYAYFFRERMPGLTTTGGYYFSVRRLRDITLQYLEWVFDDSIPVAQFPGELLGTIWWCCPANHVETATPPVGAVLPRAQVKG